jgi:hypothetical protein
MYTYQGPTVAPSAQEPQRGHEIQWRSLISGCVSLTTKTNRSMLVRARNSLPLFRRRPSLCRRVVPNFAEAEGTYHGRCRRPWVASVGLTIEVWRKRRLRRRVGRIHCSRHGSGLGVVWPYSKLALAIQRFPPVRPRDNHLSHFSMHGHSLGEVHTTTKVVYAGCSRPRGSPKIVALADHFPVIA